MKGYKAALILLVLLTGIVGAAEEEKPVDGGINLIYNAIQRNTKAVNHNSQRIEAMNELIIYQYQRWLGVYLFGTGVFMTFLYGISGMISSYYRKKGLKKTEILIEEQKKRIQEQDKYLFRTLNRYKKKQEENTKILQEYVKNAETVNKLAESVVLSEKTQNKNYNTGMIRGILITGAAFTGLIIVMEVLL